jgi:flagellar biosynthesis protein
MRKPPPDIRRAAALAYGEGDDAPRVIAKGYGVQAEAIIALAREAGVYVHQSRDLVDLLMGVEQDRCIPPELYRAVAELLAWLYRLDQMEGSHTSPATP